MTEPTLDTLKDLITEARYFVENFKPETQEDGAARESLLLRIDRALPPPPELAEACEKDLRCYLANGHDGECDGIPI